MAHGRSRGVWWVTPSQTSGSIGISVNTILVTLAIEAIKSFVCGVGGVVGGGGRVVTSGCFRNGGGRGGAL